MRVLVFGGTGRIGSSAAWDLARAEDVEEVGIVGKGEEGLKRAAAWIGSDKIRLHRQDIAEEGGTMRLMDGYDVGVFALPDRRTSYRALEMAIGTSLPAVDVLEEYHRRPDVHETEGLAIPGGMTPDEYGDSLHERAEENGVTFLDGMGFAPGLSNATIGRGIDLLDSAEAATARVGGIPSREAAANHPLRYTVTWSFAHALREYMIDARVLRGGRIVEAPPLSDRESFVFEAFGKAEALEAAVTPGMPSLLYTRGDLAEFSEKTVRWPGHWAGIDALKECGLLDLEPTEFQGEIIRPREFFVSVVEPKLRPLPGEGDVCVMYNSVLGEKGGEAARVDHHLWAGPDEVVGISAMARVTGFSAAVAARMIGRKEIKEKGIVAPEDAIRGALYERYMEELNRRGIVVQETASPRTSPIQG
ncbi:saccharopine dehydrogenase C-terminal domain-containing protein [Methanotrichaceae archaeon M04Ac]|uniref:Saccharopine dehydrogenase C-terminal domain-containing protein n=1 Tax=Candidatus Methanocrinis alkalitolerans TaxID=3033395 RepID=A0ABT5XDT5_9EURY|nr:saccharopine dehydrogenase C-terminal domain-containing protein [Candidatus Methanocrinis alkalitolerans]MCR3883897.1 saccharopine dehydrogenase NADP-binding domain-containing protein [Methanothrix sp.]MDF0592869.1 saccharopine dehydrogenase C-terminal domain-containing protein [Candidatus Methanocrinis alkalitolerans]